MARFSAFARFGHVSFSGKELPGKKIYESLKRAMGPDFNGSFNGSHTQAKLFAWAMGLATASLMLDRVKNNAIAKKATDLLPNLESQFGVVPYRGESKIARRARLHARMMVSRGSTYEAVWEILNTILGSGFVQWTTATASTLVRFPDTASDADDVCHFVEAGSQAVVLQTTGPIMPGTQTIPVTELTEKTSSTFRQAMVGRTILVDPANMSRREKVTVTAVTTDADEKIDSFTATFSNPHDVGSLSTTQYFPLWRSSAQYHFFETDASTAVDLEKRRLLNDELLRAMKSVAKWDIGSTDDYFGANALVGVHPVGPNSADDPGAWVNDLFGARLVAYWGANPVSFRFDESGNANHLSNEGTEPDKYVIDGTMGGIVLASGHEMSCDSIASIASGTDASFTVMWWGQWVSGSTPVFRFRHSSGAGRHAWEMEVSKSGPTNGVHRINDSSSEADASFGLATTDQRFFAHTFVAGGDADNLVQIDGTVTSSVSLNVNPITVDQFRVGPAAAEFRVARMIVLNDSASAAELAAVRAQWVAQAAWDA